jgi:hypothetical protein
MSIDTRTLRPLDAALALEDLDEILNYDNLRFYLEIDDRTILAQAASLRHPEMQQSDEVWQHVSGAELWGLLRQVMWISHILVSVTDPILIVFVLQEDMREYFYIDSGGWAEFISLCASTAHVPVQHPHWEWFAEDTDGVHEWAVELWEILNSKIDWAKEGF